MSYRQRRFAGAIVLIVAVAGAIIFNPSAYQPVEKTIPAATDNPTNIAISSKLNDLAVKGKAPKTGYARDQFGDGWREQNGCDTRNIILHRDLENTVVNEKCQVMSGVLDDPYTGKTIAFTRGEVTSQAVQIDHVVALSNAWQTGAQQLSTDKREALANDPLELLAVDGKANEQKSDGDAATWLPPNKTFRCQYVQRQIDVKKKYHLWVTPAEHDAMVRVLATCAAN